MAGIKFGRHLYSFGNGRHLYSFGNLLYYFANEETLNHQLVGKIPTSNIIIDYI